MQRGAAVVAFEPGYAAFKDLCDNIRLNGCDRSIVPLPATLADRTGLRELTYAHAPGAAAHALRDREWRLGRTTPEGRYTQPVCTEPLDELVHRHRLPPPHAMRIAARAGADAVLRGAARVLARHRPRSVLVTIKDADQERLVSAAAAECGYQVRAAEGTGARAAVLLTPVPGQRARPWSALRRTTNRVRTGS